MPHWDWLWCAEIEKFPSAVMAARYPHSVNLGDVTADDFMQRASSFGPIDVLAGGPPCFTAGQMVLLETGYRAIEDVMPGDMAVTHEGRLRRVLRVGSKIASVGKLSMVGNPDGIICTPNHRFLARHWRNQSTKRNNAYVRIETIGDPDWINANNMPGHQWLARNDFHVATPDMPAGITQRDMMALAGWYLGDGWIRRHTGRKKREVMFGLCDAKVEAFAARFPMVAHHVANCRTCKKLSVSNTAIANWLEQHFGKLAHGKTVPAWAMSHPERDQLLEGYLATDGTNKGRGDWVANSVSRSLALGIAALAQTLGFACSVNIIRTPDTTVIEGRTVNQRDYWQARGFKLERSRKSRTSGNHLMRTCQSWADAGEATVYDIEVEEDHSFILDGAIVHNCQAFSIAGLRNSMADDRGNLSLRFVRIAHAIRPRNLVVENVPGWLNTPDNAFGCFLGAILGHDDALCSPLDGKWPRVGMASGPLGRLCWATLDAQFFGVAQRRRRVFVVVDFGGGADPCSVLFNPESMCGNPAPRREAGQRVAGTISRRTEGGGGLGTDFEIDGGLVSNSGDIGYCLTASAQQSLDAETETETLLAVAHSLRGEGFDASEDGTGRGTPLVPIHSLYGIDNGNGACAGDDAIGTLCADSPSGGGRPLPAIAFSCKDYGNGAAFDLSPTLRSMGHEGSHANGGGQMAIAIQAGALRENPDSGPDGIGVQEGVAYTMEARAEVQAVAFSENQQANVSENDVVPALNQGGGKPGQSYPAIRVGLGSNWQVRRLTPTECERLQGFPDGFTDIEYRGKKAADGPRYKALGNSWAVPVGRWILERIERFMPETAA